MLYFQLNDRGALGEVIHTWYWLKFCISILTQCIPSTLNGVISILRADHCDAADALVEWFKHFGMSKKLLWCVDSGRCTEDPQLQHISPSRELLAIMLQLGWNKSWKHAPRLIFCHTSPQRVTETMNSCEEHVATRKKSGYNVVVTIYARKQRSKGFSLRFIEYTFLSPVDNR